MNTDQIDSLIKLGIGDMERLKYIKQSVEQGKTVYNSDRDYVERLISQQIANLAKNNESETEKVENVKPKSESAMNSNVAYCGKCGQKVEGTINFCTKCGSQLTNLSQPTYNQSRIDVELPQNFNEKSESMNVQNNTTSSPIWYFFTVLCGFVGGIISFLVLRKKQPKKAKTCLILGLVLTIGTTGIWFALMTTYGTDNPFFVVSTGSMIPELEVYDIIVANGNIKFQDVNVGDIIVFNRPNGHDRVIVHRVEAILDDNPVLKTVRTRGDANPISIPGTDYPVTDEEYIGKVVYVIPQLGYVTRVLAPPINYLIVVVIAVVALVSHFGYKRELKKNG